MAITTRHGVKAKLRYIAGLNNGPMIVLLLAATIACQVSGTTPINFVNGSQAIIEVRPDYPDYRPYSRAVAYLAGSP